MIKATVDLSTGSINSDFSPVIKPKNVPVIIVFSTSPGDDATVHLALGSQDTGAVLAYCDLTGDDDGVTFYGDLNANDTRLVAAIGAQIVIAVNCEISWEAGGDSFAVPNMPILVQKIIIAPGTSSTGGPTYLLDSVKPTMMGAVIHGADHYVARPSDFLVVTWIGSVEPYNMADNDIWEEV